MERCIIVPVSSMVGVGSADSEGISTHVSCSKDVNQPPALPAKLSSCAHDSESSLPNHSYSPQSASAKKLKVSDGIYKKPSSMPFCFFMDSQILSAMFLHVACELCNGQGLKVNYSETSRKGFCQTITLSCYDSRCKWQQSFFTSKMVNRDNELEFTSRGPKPFDVNLRAAVAFREIDKGHAAMQSFCGAMNMPPPMDTTSYHGLLPSIHKAYMSAATDSMQNASQEIRRSLLNDDFEDDKVCNIVTSTDGTWQRRGFSSLNGAVTVIDNNSGKCIDFRVLSKKCTACDRWRGREGTTAYELFKLHHQCDINHVGSAGSMEAAGVLDCFRSSVSTRSLRYTTYIGDGDTKSYQEVFTANPYPGLSISKAECLGHVQKRIGTRLRNMKSSHKGKLLDRKALGGKGRLTDKMINTLQNHYGIALRQNASKGVYAMKKAIGAVLNHCSQASSSEDRHKFCPSDGDTWCKFHACTDKSSFKEKPGLPVAIRDFIRPVFKDLSSDELLSRCVHGYTQNNNESLNGLIWKRCPKDTYTSRKVVETGICSAVIRFNDGASGLLQILRNLSLTDGAYTRMYAGKCDASRIKRMNRKSSEAAKHQRRRLRSKRKGYGDKERETEGEAYAKGAY